MQRLLQLSPRTLRQLPILTTSRSFATSPHIMSRSLREQIAFLKDYSSCDVSDALLKLQKPAKGKVAKGGYLADIVPYAPSSPNSPTPGQPTVIGVASTLKMIDKSSDVEPLPQDDPHAIPKDSHWVDEADPETILVIEQPRHQTCAAVGGIMASRMKVKNVTGCVVSGRVRDLAELRNSGLPIWATGQSTVGSGAETKVYAKNIPIAINDIEIAPGDLVFCDPLEGVVTIPQALVDEVIALMPKLVAADDKVKADVEAGTAVAAAFKKHRS